MIEQLAPDVLVKGGDYAPDQIAGASAVKARGGEVVVLPYLAGYSTTAILNRYSEGCSDQNTENDGSDDCQHGPDADKVAKAIATRTHHHQVGLVTDGGDVAG